MTTDQEGSAEGHDDSPISSASKEITIERQRTHDSELQQTPSTTLADLERKITGVAAEDFKPSKRLYVAFLTLAVITLMVALDGTSLSVALPVRKNANNSLKQIY